VTDNLDWYGQQYADSPENGIAFGRHDLQRPRLQAPVRPYDVTVTIDRVLKENGYGPRV
jgi:hypothetical protein